MRERSPGDFKSAGQFADSLLAAVGDAFAAGWASVRVRQAIRDSTKSFYEFYRLRDASPFGGRSPIKLRLGGADRAAMDFIARLDHFYFSRFADNTSASLRKFFVERYLANGAALFGRESELEMQAFRDAAGTKLKNLTDRQTRTIVQTAVQRTRNWAHIQSLNQGGFELARIVATLDARTTPLCRSLDGKLVRVAPCARTVDRLGQLEPGDFDRQMYAGPLAKAITAEPVKTVEKFLEPDGVTISDQLVETGRGFPPYHPNCRTRLEGVIEAVGRA